MSELTGQLPQALQQRPNAKSAYDICRNLEGLIQNELDLNKTKDLERSMVKCRVLVSLLCSLPLNANWSPIVREIHSCSGDRQKLLQLGKMYLDYFIRPCMFSPQSLLY